MVNCLCGVLVRRLVPQLRLKGGVDSAFNDVYA